MRLYCSRNYNYMAHQITNELVISMSMNSREVEWQIGSRDYLLYHTYLYKL